MTDANFILAEIRKQFDAWNRMNYHNKTITGDRLSWRAWQAAILADRKAALADLEPDDYQDVRPKHWLRKEITALKKSLAQGEAIA